MRLGVRGVQNYDERVQRSRYGAAAFKRVRSRRERLSTALCLLAGATMACAVTGARAKARGVGLDAASPARSAEEASHQELAASHLLSGKKSARLGDDAAAIRWCDEGLALPGVPDDLTFELRRVLVSALARGGSARRALGLLSAIANDDRLPTVELRGARAAALDRLGGAAAAAEALAEWRAVLGDATVEASYAEGRLRARLEALSLEQASALAGSAAGGDARACFALRAGVTVAGSYPGWVDRCQNRPRVVGVSLPRSGRLAGLASEHLAAVSVAVALLSVEREVEVFFEDSGSTEASAVAASRRLLQRGAGWLVGPIMPAQIRATAEIGANVVIPGEARRGGVGVAQSLSVRLATLVDEAERRGLRELFVLAPDNAYGRGVEALIANANLGSSGGRDGGDLSISMIKIDEGGADLSSKIDGLMRRLRPSSGVLIADALARVAFVVRQIRRREREGTRVVIYTTSEGLGPAVLARAASAMEGDVFAPMVGPALDVRGFDAAFELQEGRPPTDQARLVFRALALAWAGGERGGAAGLDISSSPPLYVMKGGVLVPLAAQAP